MKRSSDFILNVQQIETWKNVINFVGHNPLTLYDKLVVFRNTPLRLKKDTEDTRTTCRIKPVLGSNKGKFT